MLLVPDCLAIAFSQSGPQLVSWLVSGARPTVAPVYLASRCRSHLALLSQSTACWRTLGSVAVPRVSACSVCHSFRGIPGLLIVITDLGSCWLLHAQATTSTWGHNPNPGPLFAGCVYHAIPVPVQHHCLRSAFLPEVSLGTPASENTHKLPKDDWLVPPVDRGAMAGSQIHGVAERFFVGVSEAVGEQCFVRATARMIEC